MEHERRLTGLTSCDISDACDDLGVPAARVGTLMPAWPGCPPAVGTVCTVTLLPSAGAGSPLPELIEALRAAADPLVLVDLGGHIDVQCWGRMLATVASSFGIAGALVNGAARDVEGLREMGFPTYARAVVPFRMGDRVRFLRAGADVDIEGVAVSPGWLAVADLNGAVFVPPAAVDAVIHRARKATIEESAALEAIRAGSDPAAVLVRRAGPGSA